jgi:hypothetical protein
MYGILVTRYLSYRLPTQAYRAGPHSELRSATELAH